MRIIKPLTLKSYYRLHRDAESWLKGWLIVAKSARWRGLKDVQKTYKKADAVKVESGNTITIFDVKGNRYRLLGAIHYDAQRIYIRDFLTHAEYDDQLWKRRH